MKLVSKIWKDFYIYDLQISVTEPKFFDNVMNQYGEVDSRYVMSKKTNQV